MRVLNLVVMSLGVIILVLLGLLAMASAVYPGILINVGDLVAGPLTYAVEGMAGRMIALVSGGAILVFLIYLMLANIEAAKREKTVVLQNPTGEVMVSLPAIEDFSRVLKGKIDGLKDIRGKVVCRRKGLKVSSRVTVYSDCSIAEVAQNVQDAIRVYIQKTLNIDQEINPRVIVTKVVNRERPGVNSSGIKTTVTRKSGEGEADYTTEIPLKR